MILCCDNGLRIEGVAFALDAVRGVPFAFASHAHADHCGRHRKILATPATGALARLRYGRRGLITLPIGEPTEVEGVTVELFNAGHVLGSAQIRLQIDGRYILYTGDLKPTGGKTTPPADHPECDILIIEATYGRPEFVFPSASEVVEKLVLQIKRALVRGLTPVILAYALGKAQEVMARLADQGFSFACHRMVYDVVRVYREFGIELSGAEPLAGDRLRDRVVVMPPGLSSAPEWRLIKNPYRIFLSGWALDHTRRRMFYDETVPLSDHADYPQLLEFVQQVNPELVYTNHGFAELAGELRRRGYPARHLAKGDCIDLLTGRRDQPGATYDLFGHPRF